jgi:hypothetical protein
MSLALTVSNGVSNFWQHLQAPHGSIDLPTSMIRHNNAVASYLLGFDRILDALDAFDDEGTSRRNPLPL